MLRLLLTLHSHRRIVKFFTFSMTFQKGYSLFSFVPSCHVPLNKKLENRLRLDYESLVFTENRSYHLGNVLNYLPIVITGTQLVAWSKIQISPKNLIPTTAAVHTTRDPTSRAFYRQKSNLTWLIHDFLRGRSIHLLPFSTYALCTGKTL